MKRRRNVSTRELWALVRLCVCVGAVADPAGLAGSATPTGVRSLSPAVRRGGGVVSRSEQRRDVTNADDGDAKRRQKRAVVVGGGPVGLAAALTLSRAGFDVTVIERQRIPSQFDPAKSYSFRINRRGMAWMDDSFPSVKAALTERASVVKDGAMKVCLVPGDPKTALPEEPRLIASGTKKSSSPNQGWWIPRYLFVQLLEEAVEEQERARRRGDAGKNDVGAIQILRGRSFESTRSTTGGDIEVFTRDETQTSSGSMSASLLVAADGCNSAVRRYLAHAQCDDDATEEKKDWVTSHPKSFRLRQWTSPSVGIRTKALLLPTEFDIPGGEGQGSQRTDADVGYAIFPMRSRIRTSLDQIALVALPHKNPKGTFRPLSITTLPSHRVWNITDGSAMRDWFAEIFPRLPLHELVSPSEWDRFAAEAGIAFPRCQYARRLHITSPDGTAGVVLVGDALHAFPPDIGQGINAGLADVAALGRALRGEDVTTGRTKSNDDNGAAADATQPSPQTLGRALREYERVRGPEIRALVKYARVGSPYQYNQPGFANRVGMTLYLVNALVRNSLNKATLGIVPPQVMVSGRDETMPFRRIMRRADITTACLTLVILVGLVLLHMFSVWNPV